MSRFHRFTFLALLVLAASGCKDPAPWSGHYVLDLTPGVEQTLSKIQEDAQERGARTSQSQPAAKHLLALHLAVDGSFTFERALLGATSKWSGTYSVQEGVITLLVRQENDKPVEPPRTQGGRWADAEIHLDGWPALRRAE